MKVNAKPIVCLGILVADVVGRPMKEFPAPGRLALVDEMGLFTGGCAANTGSDLVKMGLSVEVIGKVGQDSFGDFLIRDLEQRGVGIQGIKRDTEVGSSATMVMVDPDGERRFVHYIGANASLTAADIDNTLIESASLFHLGGALVLPGIDGQPSVGLLRRARQAGAITFLDTVWDATGQWLKILGPYLPYTDYFLPSLPEAQVMTGHQEPSKAARALLHYGVKVVALKMGAAGCLVATRDGEAIRLPAFQVDAVDATGAGDAFVAGFMVGIWHGWSLEKTARFANAVGALCVTGMGASGGVRLLVEMLEFMNKTPLKPLDE
jgi:sugar/nucleoside kinase (ribokinase family)